jgi:phage terminase small subunit
MVARGHNRAKSRVVREITGNPGKRPLPDPVDLPDTGPAVRPAFLRGRAASVWDEYGPTLELLGTLRREGSHVFALWCQLAAEMERRPRAFTAAKMTQFRLLATMLGMDPSSPTKMGRAKGDDEDPAEAFFTGPKPVRDG